MREGYIHVSEKSEKSNTLMPTLLDENIWKLVVNKSNLELARSVVDGQVVNVELLAPELWEVEEEGRVSGGKKKRKRKESRKTDITTKIKKEMSGHRLPGTRCRGS